MYDSAFCHAMCFICVLVLFLMIREYKQKNLSVHICTQYNVIQGSPLLSSSSSSSQNTLDNTYRSETNHQDFPIFQSLFTMFLSVYCLRIRFYLCVSTNISVVIQQRYLRTTHILQQKTKRMRERVINQNDSPSKMLELKGFYQTKD